ncbi:hypothetical protein NEFER03_1400 [Nematocida sp. LUAm3]|nr:hypothetical protein NEFER03_1400 [Nematocida sp. LUAm3]KAI5174770.1 hypothetical protein NEFER02_0880 [Nematocida sp. LUAm2]KAI5177819.1 hypothetical protein NEFER01_1021 [Nematocida sp. LUAm1]
MSRMLYSDLTDKEIEDSIYSNNYINTGYASIEEEFIQEEAFFGNSCTLDLVGNHVLFFHVNESTKELYLHVHQTESSKCTSICKRVKTCVSAADVRGNKKRRDGSTPMACSQCGTTSTPLWRKHNSLVVCNACGLYSKIHGGSIRPSQLFRNKFSKK